MVRERVRLLSKALNGKVTMGYYVRIEEVDWEIKETPEALATIREMPKKYKAIQRGGSSNGEKWFSWMNDTEIETAETVESVFNQLGFETQKTDDGFEIIGYDSKTGQEDLFLAVMAPFTVQGSTIEWVGEDSSIWRHHINNGRMYVDEATVSWTHSKPYTYYHIDIEPQTMKMRSMNVEIYDDVKLAEQLNTAKQWNDADEAYYAEHRAKVAEAQKENAEA